MSSTATAAPAVKPEAPKAVEAEDTPAEAKSNLPLPIVDGKEPEKPTSKEKLYRQVAQRLNAKVEAYFAPVAERVKKAHGAEIKLRQVFGDQDGRDLLVIYFNGLFDILLTPDADGSIKEATVGIPAGFGSMQLTTAGATTKKTPQGVLVEVQKRWRIKYSPGKTVDGRLHMLPPPPPDAPEDNEEAATAPTTAAK